jgi:alginate O-acetyltransferase complex protein AlgI
MTFISYSFLFLFSIVMAFRLILKRENQKFVYLGIIIIASAIFYSWLTPWYLLILVFTSGVDYFAANKISRLPLGHPQRSLWLFISLAVNLSILFFFKYFDFSLKLAKGAIGPTNFYIPEIKPLNLVLPIGISFYTFEAISYTVDIYKKRIKPAKTPAHYMLFIGFFPHLVAGPIVRAREFLYQIDRRRPPRLGVAASGLYLMIRGFFSKMVIADNVGPMVDKMWGPAALPHASGLLGLVAALLFGIQIYADFDGYTSIARGAAALLGFHLPLNFNAPYIAGSFKNFWERWHITLSRWIRDYLYVPLGGNKVSKVRTYVNLMGVMLLGGLWHGAGTTYLFWGGIHGSALAIERALGMQDHSPKRPWILTAFWFLIVQIFVFIAWIFFRAQDLPQARQILKNIFSSHYVPLDTNFIRKALFLCLPVLAVHLRILFAEKNWLPRPQFYEKFFLAAVMLYGIITFYGATYGFIYFQF